MADYNCGSGCSADGQAGKDSRIQKESEWKIGSTPDRPSQPAGKEAKPLVDEAAWLRKQRDTPPALRQPLLDVVLSRLDDKKAKAECHRLFGLSKGDEARFAQSLENKVRGYEKRHGVRLSLDQVLAEEHAYQKSRNPDSSVFPDGYLDRLEFGTRYSEKSKKIISDFGNKYPHVDFSGWTKERGHLDNSLRKHNRNANPMGVESAIRGMEGLRAEMYVAGLFPDRLLAVHYPVKFQRAESDFDVALGNFQPDRRIEKPGASSAELFQYVEQIFEVKDSAPYSVNSSSFEELDDQIKRLRYIAGELCPEAAINCYFTKGVGDSVAKYLQEELNVTVHGKRVSR